MTYPIFYGFIRHDGEQDLHTPSQALCLEWSSWGLLNAAAAAVKAAAAAVGQQVLPEPFRYDLVNTAREVLAQLSSPMLLNFSASFSRTPPASAARINATGAVFIELLGDLESLLATDKASMLGPWLASARNLGTGTPN